MADHFTDGYDLEPMVALTAAAEATSTIRLQTGVLGNDYRHPVLTARMAASLDVISDGRFTLGLGAGWMRSDYDAAGIALDAAGVRVGRLEEATQVISGLLAGGRFTFTGDHYAVDLELLPSTIQRPLPLFIGGGSPRVLAIAGRHAQIVGVLASLAAGEIGRHAIVDQTSERVTEKVGWVRARGDCRRPVGRRHPVRDESLARAGDLDTAEARRVLDQGGGAHRRRRRVAGIVAGGARRHRRSHHRDCCRRGANASASAVSRSTPGSSPKDLDAIAPVVSALAGT